MTNAGQHLLCVFIRSDELYKLGDLASVLALVITIVGFSITIVQVRRSLRASEEARDHVLQMNAIHELDATIKALEDIRRLHRMNAWEAMPDRYTSVRRDLIAIRIRTPTLSHEHQADLQSALQQLSTTERQVERLMAGAGVISVDRLNDIISKQIDRLTRLLVELQRQLDI